MTNIILSGCCGKMGRVIANLAKDNDDINILYGVDPSCGEMDFDVYKSIDDCNKKADVIIDFSHPSAFDSLVSYCKRTGTPIVMCTTGLSKEQIEVLKALSTEVAVFYSANMSLGVNILIKLAQKAAKALYGNFDIEIVERHHNQKLDAPSGTALAIADAIDAALDDDMHYQYDRHARRAKRPKAEIGIHAVRGGSITGDHEVIFAGPSEVIEISHHAAGKEIFAAGSLRGAQFLKGKPAGMYSMDDMVGNIIG